MTHPLTLLSTRHGIELWTCPTCGRRMLVRWTPWEKITLVAGDPTVHHTAVKGPEGVELGMGAEQRIGYEL